MSQDFQHDAAEQAELHHVLSNPSRLMMLRKLSEGKMSVSEIAEVVGASLQNTSQHLRLMKDKGILEANRDGQTIYYEIAASPMGEKCRQMLTVLDQ